MSDRDADCVFCDILAGAAPASFVAEDDLVIAFLDIAPVNPGHTLVVPREHRTWLADLTDDEAAAMMAMARRVADAQRAASDVRCEGVNLFYADGEAAFQEVFHAHLHVLPRFAGDAFVIDAGEVVQPPRAELDGIARGLRERLDG